MHDRARGRDKSSFRGRVRNLVFRARILCIRRAFQTQFAGFGISEMRYRVRGMFIAKFYYSPPALRDITRRTVLLREQCAPPPRRTL